MAKKFRNVSDDTRHVPALGCYDVAPGDTITVDDSDVDGFAGQEAVWEPVGTQAKHAVKEAEKAADDPQDKPAK